MPCSFGFWLGVVLLRGALEWDIISTWYPFVAVLYIGLFPGNLFVAPLVRCAAHALRLRPSWGTVRLMGGPHF